MAIPGMITDFNRQNVSYGMAVGQSLQQLGQRVGQQLAMQEYQKQAAAQLPFMQEAMKGAMNKINTGDVSGGYMEAMMALPLGSQNPIVASAAENYFKGLQQAAEFKQSSLWRDLQRDQMMGRGGTATPLPSLMGAFEGDWAVEGVTPMGEEQIDFTQDIVEVPLPTQPVAAQEAAMMPETGGMAGMPSLAGMPGLAGIPSTEEAPPAGPTPQPTPMQRNAETAVRKYFSLSPREQQKMDEETTYSMEELKGNFDVTPVAGLGRFIPGATGVGVPKPITRREKSISITNEGKERLRIDRRTIDEATTRGREFAAELADDVSQLESNPSAMRMIGSAGGLNKVYAKEERGFYILSPIDGEEEIEIDQDTFKSIDRIKAARAIGAASGMPIVVGRYDFASVEEAEASGLPSGTIVYINGRKARID
jgi:hypothetical protein